MNGNRRAIGTSLIVLLSLTFITVSAGNFPLGVARAQSAPPAPQQRIVTVAQPTIFNPLTLPTTPQSQAVTRTIPFNPEDRDAFAAAKQQALTKTIGPSQTPASDTVQGTISGGGPTVASLAAPESSASSPFDPTGVGNFTGLNENGFDPPDTNISAGPSNLVEVVNARIAVYNKSGSILVGPSTLQTWFGRPSGDFLFDPVTVYRGGHFYAVTLYQNTSTLVSQILLAVSQTNNATGGWCSYALNGDQASTNWADFPRVGVTKDKILIATNQFRWDNRTFEQNFMQVLPKASVDACAALSYSTWTNFYNSNGTLGYTLNPALDYDDSSSNTFYVVNSLSSGSLVTLWQFNVAAGSWSRFDIGTQSYSVPPGARQPGTGVLIATNDARILSVVKRYNKLWAFHETALNPGCSANISSQKYRQEAAAL